METSASVVGAGVRQGKCNAVAAVLSVASLLAACVVPNVPPATPEQQAWYARRNVQPTTFEVAPEDAEIAWSRAKAWLSRYSDYKLQIVDEGVLETYTPVAESAVRFGYAVTREKLSGGAWRFHVRGATGNYMAGHIAHAMAQALALYIVTGEECPGCSSGIRR
jgi:hypothetical protein